MNTNSLLRVTYFSKRSMLTGAHGVHMVSSSMAHGYHLAVSTTQMGSQVTLGFCDWQCQRLDTVAGTGAPGGPRRQPSHSSSSPPVWPHPQGSGPVGQLSSHRQVPNSREKVRPPHRQWISQDPGHSVPQSTTDNVMANTLSYHSGSGALRWCCRRTESH